MSMMLTYKVSHNSILNTEPAVLGLEMLLLLTWANPVCQDDGNAEENWPKAQDVSKAVKLLKGWYLAENVIKAAQGRLIDWKLMWRNPQPNWVSPKGRILQIGDCAHSFLPTSASGGTMAFEDSFSIATCLEVAGKENIPTALRAHNKMRYVLFLDQLLIGST